MTERAPGAWRPRLGFLGVGWIGLDRMKAMLATGAVEAAAIVEPAAANARAAAEAAPAATRVDSLDQLLDQDLDGVVIATPSALHAEQAVTALSAGAAVFCQKPLGRDAAETRRVVDAARAADRLLAVDLSYRHTQAAARMAEAARSGELGRIFFADLVFHNAYGPDKPWFDDRRLSGGGCVIDLGVHLVDLALWLLDFPKARVVSSALRGNGAPLSGEPRAVEDFAVATLDLAGGAVARIACSWRLNAGAEAEIAAKLYGGKGAVSLRNVGGSFHDFLAERFSGTNRWTIASPPDAWGGRAAADWALRLAADERFDPGAERLVDVAVVLDEIYAVGLKGAGAGTARA